MIAILKAMEWRVLARAVKHTFTLFGLAGLVAWFAQPWPWYAQAASAVVVAASIACLYGVLLRIEQRRRRKQFQAEHSRINRRMRNRGQSWARARDLGGFEGAMSTDAALGEAQYRRRFVRFNPDSGEEEFKYELQN